MNIPKNKGFTLIELLVVIAIIAILTSIVLANLSGPRQKARDAKRISDLAQIQLMLEQFFDRCYAYPVNIDTPNAVTSKPGTCIGVNIGTFMSVIPKDPDGVTLYEYHPITTSSGGEYIDYVLKASLEGKAPSDRLKDVTGYTNWFSGNAPTCDQDTDYCVTSK